MKFEEYYICGKDGKSNCVVRSLCKVLNKSYEEVYDDMLRLSQELNVDFNDVVVFETYMEQNHILKEKDTPDVLVKDLILERGSYIIFCYDKKDWYHMIPLIQNTIYDKNEECLNLYVLSIYKYHLSSNTI